MAFRLIPQSRATKYPFHPIVTLVELFKTEDRSMVQFGYSVGAQKTTNPKEVNHERV